MYRLRAFFTGLILSLVLFSSALCSESLDFGTAGVMGLTVEKENELGNYFQMIARSSLPLVKDPAMQQYIDSLAGRLAANADGVRYPFSVILVDDKTINASAFFGGKIMLNTGLFNAVRSESELASVLAHEMTHVTQRHIARSIEEQSKARDVGLAGILGGIMLAIINPAVGMATVSASLGGIGQSAVNYTRSNEYEADRIGISLLYNSGFDPNAMGTMLRNLRSNGENVNPAFEMLMTHPLTEKRIAEAENRARLFPVKTYYESVDFSFAKSRVMARFGGFEKKYIRTYAADQLKIKPTDPGIQYLSAITAVDSGNLKEAKKMLDKLSVKYKHNSFVIDTYADYYSAAKDYVAAEKMLTSELARDPNNEVVVVNLASVYLDEGKNKEAIRILRKLQRSKLSEVGDSLLIKAYKKERDTCDLYQLNTTILAYNANFDSALQNAESAVKTCKDDDTILRMRAQASEILKQKDFYEKLLKQ